MTESKTILVGVCGGIAAYKAAEVVSRLAQNGYAVHVAMTEAAQRFVTATTFASLSRRRVLTAVFPAATESDGEDLFPHLYPASRADLFVVLPGTADILAKIGAGIGDDIVSCAVLALPPTCRRVFCPAMNTGMWRQRVTQANVRRLEEEGWIRVGPAAGALACGVEGEGRMSEPAEILTRLQALLQEGASLAGRTVLILSGPTREHLDPVRYVGNASSGRMGQALAEEALARGARVRFVTGPVENGQLPRGGERLSIERVTSASEMLAAAEARSAEADVWVFAAAVADYAPVKAAASKGPKKPGPVTLELAPTRDIAATLCAGKRSDQVAIGFALETEDGLRKAQVKREAKHLDAIVLNGAASMGAAAAAFHFLPAGGDAEDWGTLCKAECAGRMLTFAAARLEPRPAG